MRVVQGGLPTTKQWWWAGAGQATARRIPYKLVNITPDQPQVHGCGSGGSPKAVVVGGGWAGYGAAHTLLKEGFQVTLLDAGAAPGGLSTGFRTAAGRSVEAGIKGCGH
jgi:NADPH-dependent 2,4-dienoyl-CoA reductase/sulfur reductase-like enzyme